MSRTILIDHGLFETRIAVTQDHRLTDLIIEPANTKSLVDDIYLGRIEGFSDAMDAAFVDLGKAGSGLLLGRDTPAGRAADKSMPIRQKLHEGEKCLVQVIKDKKDDKRPQISAFIELGTQNIILKPASQGITFSRNIKDKPVRQALQQAFGPFDGGVTVRSHALLSPVSSVAADLKSLTEKWQKIQLELKAHQTPRRLSAALPHALKIAYNSTAADTDITHIIVNDLTLYQDLSSVLGKGAPENISCRLWTNAELIFDKFDLETQIEDACALRLPLPSGGNITIEETEALVVIDVNSGALNTSVGLKSAAQQTNEEAARLAAEHAKIRNLSGIIIIDFIQTSDKDSARQIQNILTHVTANDPSAVRVIGMTELGLMQMTRRRKSPPLSTAFKSKVACGTESIPRNIASAFVRDIQRFAVAGKTPQISVSVSPDLAPLLKAHQSAIENTLALTLDWQKAYSLRKYDYSLSDARI